MEKFYILTSWKHKISEETAKAAQKKYARGREANDGTKKGWDPVENKRGNGRNDRHPVFDPDGGDSGISRKGGKKTEKIRSHLHDYE